MCGCNTMYEYWPYSSYKVTLPRGYISYSSLTEWFAASTEPAGRDSAWTLVTLKNIKKMFIRDIVQKFFRFVHIDTILRYHSLSVYFNIYINSVCVIIRFS